MLTSQDPQDALFRFAATQLTGWQRRVFVGEVTNKPTFRRSSNQYLRDFRVGQVGGSMAVFSG